MEFDVVEVVWFALLVLIIMAFYRTAAGLLSASDNSAAQAVGRGLGAIVG